jgi:uncharacterized membrane protein (DUF4010 family)
MAAWAVMFLRIIVIAAVLNRNLLTYLWIPMTVALLVSVCYCTYLFVYRKDQASSGLEDFKNPFDLIPAITFGLLYAVILLLAHWAQIYFGDAGAYVSGVVSGLVDVDAITVSMSQLSSQGGGLEPATASRAIVFAAASNTLVKGCIVLFTATASLRKIIFPGMVLILATAVGVAMLI